MKKSLVFVLMLVMLCGVLCACGGKESKTYKVKFDLNGGEKISGKLTQTVEEGKAAEAPEVEREGYVFDGWSEDFDDVTEDLKVKANWKKLYLVTFDADGGVLKGKSEQYVSKASELKLPTATKEGYEFAGWDKDTDSIDGDTEFVATWKAKVLKAEEVYEKIEPSVVEILVYNKDQEAFAVGSGFFIDDEGTIATNNHVIEGAYYIEVHPYSGDVVYADTVLGASEELDLALIKVSNIKSVPVTISDRSVVTGETVYTLGSSKGLTDTFSDGIVSNVSRVVDGKECIQITAPISSGNSGGPLIDKFGNVLGINSMVYIEGQNLNFSIKIGELNKLDTSNPMTPLEFGALTAPEEPEVDNQYEFTSEENRFINSYDYFEYEVNDSFYLADELKEEYFTAGYAGIGDYDIFTFTVDKDMVIDIALTTCWEEDQDVVLCGLLDENTEVVTNSTGSTALAYNDELCCQVGQYSIKAGTYYVMVFLPEDYEYESGAVYALGWMED